MDCEEQAGICDKENVKEFPTFRVYPPFPVPVNDIAYTEKFDGKMLRARAGKYIKDHSIEINSNNHKTFVSEDVTVPKVLLFTNSKKGTPFVFKALSEQFAQTL